jgi:hypothetical protein
MRVKLAGEDIALLEKQQRWHEPSFSELIARAIREIFFVQPEQRRQMKFQLMKAECNRQSALTDQADFFCNQLINTHFPNKKFSELEDCPSVMHEFPFGGRYRRIHGHSPEEEQEYE